MSGHKRQVASVACFIGAILSATAQTPKPVSSLDLRSLAEYREAVPTAEDFSRFSIDFVDNNTVAVAAEFRWTDKGPREPVQSNTAVFAIDARNGTPQSSEVWKGSRGLPAVL